MREERAALPWPERVAALLGLLLVLGALGLLLYEGLSGDGAPPDIEIRVESIRAQPSGSGYLVEIVAANRGGQTGAEVRVSGELLQDGQAVETSTAVFDYIPDRSERRGGLFFRRDPRAYALQLRATGYVEP